MTSVRIVKSKLTGYKSFEVSGHSGYAEAGSDIVCAAISILTINTMNAIEQFTDVDFTQEVDEEACSIRFMVEEPTNETTLLLETMVLGLQTLEDDNNYTEYIDIIFEEV